MFIIHSDSKIVHIIEILFCPTNLFYPTRYIDFSKIINKVNNVQY